MVKNVGTIDRVVRIVFALVVAALVLMGTLSGVGAVILGVLAVVLFVTGVIGFCPLYRLFNLSTQGR